MRLNVPRAARILVDAEILGDVKAAEKWQVDERTIRNYRTRLKTDPDLSEAFADKVREAERGWHLIRNRFLRDVTEHLRDLCLKATVEQISDVREALKDIGELEIAREALGVGASARREDSSVAGASRQGDAEGDEGSSGSGADG